MIFDRKDKELAALDAFEAASDEPPSYDSLEDSGSRRQVVAHGHASSSASRPSIVSSLSSRFAFSGRSRVSSSFAPVASGHERSKPETVIPTAASQEDVRKTVRGLIHDVVQLTSPMRSNIEAAEGLLDSCASSCKAQHLSLARILQERTIEGHSALYWAIAMRQSVRQDDKDARRGGDAFILAVVKHAVPLAPGAITELRNACSAVSDNTLYQQIRFIPGVFPLPGTDRMLLHGTARTTTRPISSSLSPEIDEKNSRSKGKEREALGGFEDKAELREWVSPEAEDSFCVDLELQMFQRRMRVTKSLSVEFIARGRLWMLTCFVVPQPAIVPDTWYAPATFADEPALISSPQSTLVAKAAVEGARKAGIPIGSWAASLALLEDSPRTFADAWLIVKDHSQTPRSPAPDNANFGPPESEASRSRPRFFDRKSSKAQPEGANSRPNINLYLCNPVTGRGPLLSLPSSPPADVASPFAYPDEVDLSERTKRERKVLLKEEKRAAKERAEKEAQQYTRERLTCATLIAGFEGGKALMYDGCPYIALDDTLRATLAVQLDPKPKQKPKTFSRARRDDDDCVIC